MRRTVCFILAVIFMAAAALSSYAYTITDYSMYTGGFKAVANSGGLYMLGYSGKELDIERVVPDSAGATLTLGYTCVAASVFGDTAAALCNDLDNDQLIVYTYDISSDILDSFAVNGASVRYDKGFCYDGRYLYLPDDRNNRVMNRYSTGGRAVSSYTFPDDIIAVVSGYSSGFYVVSGNSLYVNSGDSYAPVSGCRISAPAAFCTNDVLSDRAGRVYRVSGGTAKLLFTAEAGGDYAAGCADSSGYYIPCDGVINKYDPAGNKKAYIDIGSDCSAMYAYSGAIYAAGTARVSAVDKSEFVAVRTAEIEAPTAARTGISSKIYRLDNRNLYISGISSPTTLAQFKSNMSYDGYSLSFYRNDKKQSSGLVGTAMTAVFEGGDSYIYELAVNGDITGEGNVNSRDTDEMMDYLLGTVIFDGVYSIAADVSSDGVVDTLDLAMLCRMNK